MSPRQIDRPYDNRTPIAAENSGSRETLDPERDSTSPFKARQLRCVEREGLSTSKNRGERLAIREIIFAYPDVVEHA